MKKKDSINKKKSRIGEAPVISHMFIKADRIEFPFPMTGNFIIERRNECCANLFSCDNIKENKQLLTWFNINSAYGVLLAKRYNINFQKMCEM